MTRPDDDSVHGELSITRQANSGMIQVRVDWLDKGDLQTFTAELGPAEFGQAITGLGARPCEINIRNRS